MERKTWLETFLRLADSNANSLEYRKHLRLKASQLPALVKKIPEFRKELAQLQKEDEDSKNEFDRTWNKPVNIKFNQNVDVLVDDTDEDEQSDTSEELTDNFGN